MLVKITDDSYINREQIINIQTDLKYKYGWEEYEVTEWKKVLIWKEVWGNYLFSIKIPRWELIRVKTGEVNTREKQLDEIDFYIIRLFMNDGQEINITNTDKEKHDDILKRLVK